MTDFVPDWFNPQNIAGFQTFPTYRVIFRDDRPSQQITISELIWACRQLGMSISSLFNKPLTREEAISLYCAGEITEGRLSASLGVNRLEARRILQESESKND